MVSIGVEEETDMEVELMEVVTELMEVVTELVEVMVEEEERLVMVGEVMTSIWVVEDSIEEEVLSVMIVAVDIREV